MNIEEIRKNAPLEATHYDVDDEGNVSYYLDDEGHWLVFDDQGCAWNLFSGDFKWYEENTKPLF